MKLMNLFDELNRKIVSTVVMYHSYDPKNGSWREKAAQVIGVHREF